MCVFVWYVQIHAYSCTQKGQRELVSVLFYHCSLYFIGTGSLNELGDRLEMIKPNNPPVGWQSLALGLQACTLRFFYVGTQIQILHHANILTH